MWKIQCYYFRVNEVSWFFLGNNDVHIKNAMMWRYDFCTCCMKKLVYFWRICFFKIRWWAFSGKKRVFGFSEGQIWGQTKRISPYLWRFSAEKVKNQSKKSVHRVFGSFLHRRFSVFVKICSIKISRGFCMENGKCTRLFGKNVPDNFLFGLLLFLIYL